MAQNDVYYLIDIVAIHLAVAVHIGVVTGISLAKHFIDKIIDIFTINCAVTIHIALW